MGSVLHAFQRDIVSFNHETKKPRKNQTTNNNLRMCCLNDNHCLFVPSYMLN